MVVFKGVSHADADISATNDESARVNFQNKNKMPIPPETDCKSEIGPPGEAASQ